MFLLIHCKQTFGCSSQDLCEAVRLRCAAVLLCLQPAAIVGVAGMRGAESRRANVFGEDSRAGGEAGWSGQGAGRWNPARNVKNPLNFQLIQVVLDDLFSL